MGGRYAVQCRFRKVTLSMPNCQIIRPKVVSPSCDLLQVRARVFLTLPELAGTHRSKDTDTGSLWLVDISVCRRSDASSVHLAFGLYTHCERTWCDTMGG